MAVIGEHEDDCRKLLGKAYYNVHRTLDQFARDFPIAVFCEYHRTFLHNAYGINVIDITFGEDAKKAAIIHIVRDWHEMPLGEMKWEWVISKLGKALIHFNRLDQFDPRLDPGIMNGWKGKSLCAIAFEN